MKSSKGKAPKPHNRVPRWSRRGWLLIALALSSALAITLFLTREDPQQLLHRGESLLARDPRQAGQLLERSVDVAGGDFPAAQLLLCLALGRQQRWVEAWGCFSLIKDKSACDGQRLLELGSAAFAADEPILAEQALAAALKTSISEVDVLTVLIPIRLTLGHEEQALADCRRLAELDPSLPGPLVTQARLLRRRRETLAAAAAYRQALPRSKDRAETAGLRRELVEVLVQQGNGAEARREFAQLDKQFVAGDSLALLQAYILRLERHSREAVEEVERYLAIHPDHADAALLQGTLYFDLGEYDRAAATLRRLTQLRPLNKEAHYVLGQSYLKLGRPEAAGTHLETSRKLTAMAQEIRSLEGQAAENPSDATLKLRLAELYEATGQPDVGTRWRDAAARVGSN